MEANMAKEYPINRDDFRTWLRSGPEDRIVGMQCVPCKCPLSLFLAGTYGQEFSVTPRKYRPTNSEYAVCLPDWAVRFVYDVDRQDLPGLDVSANLALRILGPA
jgi:hypothetical protein